MGKQCTQLLKRAHDEVTLQTWIPSAAELSNYSQVWRADTADGLHVMYAMLCLAVGPQTVEIIHKTGELESGEV